MKLQLFTIVCAVLAPASAAFSGDIVGYWNGRVNDVLVASSPRISSLREAYYGAVVHTAILKAADDTERRSANIRQTAISHAAHNILVRHFGGQWRSIGAFFRQVEDQIGASTQERRQGKEIGERAAAQVLAARVGDNFEEYIRYDFLPVAPGIYQPTPPSNASPADPHGGNVRPFGGIRRLPVPWAAPPNPRAAGYIAHLQELREKGARTNHTRTADETEIGLYWLESSIIFWNRFARAAVGTTLDSSISRAALFYARLSWGIANAGIIGFDSKNRYNAWRPITALHFTAPYLAGGVVYNDPTWIPLIDTPGHQDYLSGHSVYAAGAAGIIRAHLGTDPQPPDRPEHSINTAVLENGSSRVFIGAHFRYATDEGTRAGFRAASDVWSNRAENYL
ncbi:acid phosphatase/Vanadium-dependent haloperoxidase [Coprinopsis marcescibilis]|uniref:Acid phosphatase/Vanadium-dependent haloperoxidase n=1 Tax=Coprinopsis marcescibilis TaxID=230819 RepID=A0A5C3L7Q1_COPMA|nr:acid phosphatase/Vanadium-dependent haloperoxidase [Coprinopsis marcescibilis]